MAQHSDHERKSRKKSSRSSSKGQKSRSPSKKRHALQPATSIYTQTYALPVPPVQTQSSTYNQPYSQPIPSPPPVHPAYATSSQHPIYGRMPSHPPQYGHVYGSSPPQPLQSYASQSAVGLAPSPPHKPREEGSFKEQWEKLDRIAAKSYADLRTGACKSASKVTTNCIERPTHAVAMKSMQALCQGAALCDIITSKFDTVITNMDGGRFSGKEQELMIYNNEQVQPSTTQPSSSSSSPPVDPRCQAPNEAHQMLGGDKGSNYFSKVWSYSNSRLPPHLPPFKVYLPTYPLLCLAATYSEKVYTPPPKSEETETHIPSDWRTGTKAMVLKSIPIEEMNTVVFAIRGTGSFMDWAVNYNSSPVSPDGFLEDPSNLCHAGFLYVAKRMVEPVADRLRKLLEENPSRSLCSLLITGHSAGGAVAALLYAHMMSQEIESELSYLTGFFKRVHCITFGAPPITMRALTKPDDKRHRKSLFYAIINEGDPVPRADKPFIRSLLKLYVTPAPSTCPSNATITVNSTMASMSKLNLSQQQSTSSSSKSSSPPPSTKTKKSFLPSLSKPSKSSLQPPPPSLPPRTSTTTAANAATSTTPAHEWKIPRSTLAPAGRLVILRETAAVRADGGDRQGVEAVTVDEEQFRKLVYGDPEKHQMAMYRKRMEAIAIEAVTAGSV